MVPQQKDHQGVQRNDQDQDKASTGMEEEQDQ